MHHGNGPQNAQRQLQRSRSFTGSESEDQQATLPQSPAASFAPSASPSAPQSPGYQIQQFIMSRSPVAGQNVNITLQNVGSVTAGNQQITLTPLPIPSPTSPSFQFSPQQRRFEHGSPSYIQVTSPLPPQVQSQSPTQPNPVPVQSISNVRTGTPGPGLGMCSQSPTRGFVDASVLVRQISLSPSNGGHFVYQEGSGITQLSQGAAAQVQLASPGAPATVRERRLSQPHSQTGGTIHHLGPQSPVASGANIQPLPSPGHITTNNLPPQISNIIQGMQQQQVLQGQQLSRPLGYDRTPGGLIAGVGGPPTFGMTSAPPPTSPSRASMAQGLTGLPLAPSVCTVVKKAKKMEEIPPATQETAQMRKQCLEHHLKQMEVLKETFKEYLIELFFLQHLQGNMMDFLAFKKKLCMPLQAYLRQNDLDLEEEEEEEQSEVINDEVKVVTGKDGQTGTPVAIATQLPPNVSAAFSSQQQPFQQVHAGAPVTGTVNAIEIEAFKRQQALSSADSSKRPRIEVGRHGMVFQHPGVASGVPLQQLMPTAQGGMPPTPQAVQLTGQKQSQQQYDPSKGPPVQNAASLHTPPPQLPGRLQPTNVPVGALPATLQLTQQQPQITEAPVQPQAPTKASPQTISVSAAVPHSQVQTPLQQQVQLAAHAQGPVAAQISQPQAPVQQQTVTLARASVDSVQNSQRLPASTLPPTSSNPPAAISTSAPQSTYPAQASRTSPATNKSVSPVASKPPGLAVTAAPKTQSPAQNTAVVPQDSSQEKLAEQVKLENQVHQRIAELRKEGLWSLRRLPKLQEAPRPKSHWDYLLEEMQWMATDFAQERMWKMAAAKKMVRTVARYHEEKKLNEERAKKEEQNKLRRIAASIAREIEYFWSNIEQVVEIKLQIEFQEKRRKALNLKRRSRRGKDTRHLEELLLEKGSDLGSWSSGRKRKASTSLTDDEVEDEEETIEEQEMKEGNVNHQMELSNLAKEAELPLDDLVKMYEGAFAENFHWPQPKHDEEETSEEEMDDHAGERELPPKETILIDSLLSIDQYKGVERAISTKKHGRDIAEVAAAAESLLPKGSARITTAVKYNTPPLLYGSLREYQKIGLDWLAKLYKKNLNGILADEAGLGKTVQVTAFFAHLACNEGDWGPHLVVVRSCNILKWELELKRWCPGLKILLYIGSQRELRAKRQAWSEPNSFNVCITSYKQLFKGHQAFMKMRWKYLVVDEMQQIKNMTEKHWEALLCLRSQHRLLLIDTPLHNTLMELWTMVHFLIPGISKAYLDFPVKAANEENQDYCHKLVIRLHRMIQPFILRRSKRDVEKQLTKKYEHVLKCRLSNRQKAMYEDVILQPGTQDALKSGHFVSVLHVLMQLQKICNHPDLINPRLSSSSYVSDTLQFRTASLALKALERDLWNDTDLFDLIGIENGMTRYESQVLPKQKVTRKLIEEIYTSPPPPPRPNPVKLKPSRLFQPVQYGQKPEGRIAAFPSTQVQRTATTATVAQQGQVRGRSPVATVSANQAVAAPQFQTSQASSVSAPRQQAAATFATAASSPAHPAKPRAQTTVQALQLGQAQPQAPATHTIQQSVLPQRLVLTSQAQARLPSKCQRHRPSTSLPGAQGRMAQPETPVTLQFQGNKFTLSHSQLRQLTAGQPLQLQGSVLQIVSAPGQQYVRPQAPVVMQTVPQGGTIQNALNALGNQHQAGLPASAMTPQNRTVGANLALGDSASTLKPGLIHGGHSQESFEEKNRLLRERLDRLFLYNERRCSRRPVYGRDLVGAFSVVTDRKVSPHFSAAVSKWRWAGFANCSLSLSCSGDHSDPLQGLVRTLEQQQESLTDVVNRGLCVLPAAVASPPSLHVAKLPALYSHRTKLLRRRLKEAVSPCLRRLQRITAPQLLQFPDLRLVQCDAGKLEALAILLQKLKLEGRRVLILSQMILMLDILELFLNFHFLTYVRIDEYANQEERQELMKTFNRDKRIFCAILSSHSRSTGVNLVEADTVVFYDNDLNPVMDAKAQEWCDRIGRCKDIHIYRLVSGNSVEEKLLKNGTKDLIREVAAQGNDYSMAFLTQQTIQELFEVHSPMEDSGFRVKAEEFVVLSQEPSPAETISPKVARPFIEALKSTEREAEEPHGCVEDMETESALEPLVSEFGKSRYLHEPSQLQELVTVVDQLTPIEKYALNYLELFHISTDDSEAKDSQMEAKTAKKVWETRHLKELKEEDERMLLDGDEEELLTYTREDAYSKEYIYEGPDGQTEIMPLWTPPTPPQDDNDIYIDSVMCLMYETTPIPESKLPPVYVRKERKRHKTDPSAAGRKKKQRHGETVIPPRSLFDRATPGMLKVRREGKEQKKNILLKQQTQFAKPLPTLMKPAAEAGQDNPEWLISEDWALLQAVKQLLELPLNLAIVSPAHTPNWDLVCDVVNSCSRVYRSPKQCRSRYENVIIPREEGKLMYEANPKKKTKSIYKTFNELIPATPHQTKNSRPLRTNQLYAQDEGATHTQLYTNHFEIMKMIAGKRSPPIKPLLGMNPFQKNPKHTSVLAESGINYDKPLPPIQVASLRAERIAKEKKALAEQQRAQQQAGPQQQQQQQQTGQQQAQQAAVQQAQPQPQAQAQVVQQPQAVVQTSATTVANTTVLAGTMKTSVTGTSIQTATVSGNVIVNTVPGAPSATFQPINKRLASPVIPGTLAASGGAATAQVVHTQQRPAAAPAASAELVTLASTQGVRAVTSVTASAVVTTNLTPVQTQPRSLVTQVTPAAPAGVQLSGKTLSQAHFQILRQQQQAASQVQVPQIQTQGQAQSPAQIKAVGKLSQEQLIKLQKQKLQLPQQQAGQQTQAGAPQQSTQVQVQQQQPQQLTAVAAPRPGAVLTGTTVTNLQVARLTRVPAPQLQAQGQIQAQTPQAAQVALAKPPVVSVPAAVVSSAGVTTLPVTVAGISVAIGQPQKAAGGQTVVAQPLHVQQLLKLKHHHQAAQQQKAIQPQVAQGQSAVQQKMNPQQVTVQAQQQTSQQQKVAYATQPAIKTQFLTTPISQAQKSGGTQQVQTQIQVAKIPQVVSQQAAVANIQQMVSVSQQVQAQPQTVTLTQTTAGQQQVQVIPATTATAQVVQQKLIQQQVVTTASPQLQGPGVPNPNQAPAPADSQTQQAKMRAPVRLKAPNKPS
ncbi:E1A-binding protein p400 isoform X5 [Sphaerodactylus townsendi]|uniref:E1A-binding protein p400 isoform X5 n=1 Tax=Sphaerodactylus townsendi TaxID=933632 RepID=UPI00202615AB|nr:E1A-binding protein p400 isoform X5 [Sphaerodactylus townsendi]